MSAKPPVIDQINIVAKDLHASMAFYRRLRVSFREGDQAGDLFHLNGESGDNVALDLDSPGFAQIWNKGWAGRNDLQYASNCALSSAKLEGRIAKAVLLASGPQVEQR